MNTIHDTASKLFSPEPTQWGLRGDPHLWQEMRDAVGSKPMPDSVESLTRVIEEVYMELTGRPMSQQKPFYVPRLNHGGMSGGVVSPSFWLERALPLLRKRLEDYRADQRLGRARS